MDRYSVLERRISRLEDERQIERLKQRYTAYCDAGYDANGIISLFVPDGRWICTRPVTAAQRSATTRAPFFPTLAASISWAQHSRRVQHPDRRGRRTRSRKLLSTVSAHQRGGQRHHRHVPRQLRQNRRDVVLRGAERHVDSGCAVDRGVGEVTVRPAGDRVTDLTVGIVRSDRFEFRSTRVASPRSSSRARSTPSRSRSTKHSADWPTRSAHPTTFVWSCSARRPTPARVYSGA